MLTILYHKTSEINNKEFLYSYCSNIATVLFQISAVWEYKRRQSEK